MYLPIYWYIIILYYNTVVAVFDRYEEIKKTNVFRAFKVIQTKLIYLFPLARHIKLHYIIGMASKL